MIITNKVVEYSSITFETLDVGAGFHKVSDNLEKRQLWIKKSDEEAILMNNLQIYPVKPNEAILPMDIEIISTPRSK